MYSVIRYISQVSLASEIKLQKAKGKAQFLADRIQRCAQTCETLTSFLQALADKMQVDLDGMHGDCFAAAFAAAQSDRAPAILDWLRKYPTLAASLAFEPDETRKALCESIALDEPTSAQDVRMPARKPFDFEITVTCQAPLSHGADQVLGNAVTFRRMAVGGKGTIWLPYYSGNALRGQLRDILADHLCDSLGLGQDLLLEPWFFHVLYSGGALAENSEAQRKIDLQLGVGGNVKGQAVRLLRDALPGLSLLGCALGNRIVSGRIMVGDLRPRCKEWGTGESPAKDLFCWLFATRRDDYENREKTDDYQGMIMDTECLRPGTVLDGGIDMQGHIQPLERSALGYALSRLKERAYLGGMKRQGLGRVDVQVENCPDPDLYLEFIRDRKGAVLEYIVNLGGVRARG